MVQHLCNGSVEGKVVLPMREKPLIGWGSDDHISHVCDPCKSMPDTLQGLAWEGAPQEPDYSWVLSDAGLTFTNMATMEKAEINKQRRKSTSKGTGTTTAQGKEGMGYTYLWHGMTGGIEQWVTMLCSGSNLAGTGSLSSISELQKALQRLPHEEQLAVSRPDHSAVLY